uniref:HTH cro/C1-type domain-containing protein n=1 Tax=uncultured Spirochaetaceae bacterium TaxID=201186 RepID=A0A650EP58_9SPIO|nr:hypothetical protein Unknown280_0480 [uncultured Spirochaetaceae bacterium]
METLIDIPKLFGGNLRRLRKSRNLTQTQLAEMLDVTQKHLSVIETGTQFVSAPLIAKIAAALQVEPAELFGGASSEARIVNAVSTRIINLINPKFELMARQIVDDLKSEKKF